MRRVFRRQVERSDGAFAHTAQRAEERIGVSIEPSDYRKAVRAISSGQVPLLKHVGGHRFIAMVRLKGKKCTVVFDVEFGRIVTVLP